MTKTAGDPHTHTVLVRRMARATGTALTDAPDHQAALAPSEWSAMLERCQSCAQVGACRSWLEHLELGEETADAAPEFCNNQAVFQRLPAAE